MKVTKLIFPLLIVAAYILIFRSFFTSSHLVWGDAPYFYSENLKELFSKPLLWDYRNDNFGSSQSLTLWLYLPTFLYGSLNHYLNLSNDTLIRIIFLFPATILSILGSFTFLKRYSKNFTTLVLGSFLYSFNTYFLLLIDGGQVGVSLAYGLFPWVVMHFLNVYEKLNIKTFILCLSTFFIISNVDIRIAGLSLAVSLILTIFESDLLNKIKRILLTTTLIGGATATLNLFWLTPLILSFKSGETFPLLGNLTTNFISLLDAMIFYNPIFPANEFGNTHPVPFYFILLPILIFGGILFKNPKEVSKKYFGLALVYLFFTFLAKGASSPFGFIYQFLIDKIPLFISFRDSTKFYIPLILVGSMLFVYSIDTINKKINELPRNKNYLPALFLGVFIYLSLLVYPAFFGRLTGVLNIHPQDNANFNNVYTFLNHQPGAFRTLWFPEKPPLSFSDWSKPAISANNLYQNRPFASMINGTYDLFGYLNGKNIIPWFKLLGIKYVFLPPDPRKKEFTRTDLKNRSEFLSFADKIFKFQKLNINTSFPVYSLDGVNQKIFAVKKVYLVIGGDEIYKKYLKSHSSLTDGFIFLEDRQVNPDDFQKVDPIDAQLIFSGLKGVNDLSMQFLKDQIFNESNLVKSNWGSIASDKYLDWKYELLKQGVRNYDYPVSDKMRFSSVGGETLSLSKNLSSPGEYFLALRYVDSSSSAQLKVHIDQKDINVPLNTSNQIRWTFSGPLSLSGFQNISIENSSGFHAVDGVALINQNLLNQAKKEATSFASKFNSLRIDESQSWPNFRQEADSVSINYNEGDPTRYLLTPIKGYPWIIFADHYSPGWTLSEKIKSIPVYSMTNGFYLKDSEERTVLEYSPEKSVGIGIKGSLLGVALLMFITLYFLLVKKNE